MMSFRGKRLEALQPPLSLFWLVEALGESKGRQEVYKRQSPRIPWRLFESWPWSRAPSRPTASRG